ASLYVPPATGRPLSADQSGRESMVEGKGFEPSTSALPTPRTPNRANPPGTPETRNRGERILHQAFEPSPPLLNAWSNGPKRSSGSGKKVVVDRSEAISRMVCKYRSWTA